MVKFFRKIFCNHYFTKHELIDSKREGVNNLVVSSTIYTCYKCGKFFKVIDNIKVEKDYYKIN